METVFGNCPRRSVGWKMCLILMLILKVTLAPLMLLHPRMLGSTLHHRPHGLGLTARNTKTAQTWTEARGAVAVPS